MAKIMYNDRNYTAPGSGTGGSAVWGDIGGTLSNQTDLQTALDAKQASLVSGTNIKTINGNSLLGSGNIEIPGGGTTVVANPTLVGTEGNLEGIQIGNVKYNVLGYVKSQAYLTWLENNMTQAESQEV